jgi:predicted ChrR family anti-sigma factor
MSEPRDDRLEFVREAADDEPLDATPLERLPELFDRAAPEGLDRLLEAVSLPPLRYAPFYGRLSALWDVPEAEVQSVLERSRDPQAWRKPGLPGLMVVDVDGGPRLGGADAKLVRFSPGFRFPNHRHPGYEAVFVLEGSYTESTGRVVGPGDLHEMQAGTEHHFTVARDEPCIAASVQAGLEFTGMVMRLLSKVFG